MPSNVVELRLIVKLLEVDKSKVMVPLVVAELFNDELKLPLT